MRANIPPSVASSSGYQQYSTMYPGSKENVHWMFWDTNLYVSGAGGSTLLTFFTALRATKDLSNMLQPGQFPAPYAFLIRQYRFHVKQQPRTVARAATANPQPGAIDNIQQLINGGVLVFRTGSKDYGEHPLWMVPAGAGAYGGLAVDGDTADPGLFTDYALNGVPDAGGCYSLGEPLFIPPLASFSVTVTWPAPLTLAGGSTNVCVVLDGDLIRPVQ